MDSSLLFTIVGLVCLFLAVVIVNLASYFGAEKTWLRYRMREVCLEPRFGEDVLVMRERIRARMSNSSLNPPNYDALRKVIADAFCVHTWDVLRIGEPLGTRYEVVVVMRRLPRKSVVEKHRRRIEEQHLAAGVRLRILEDEPWNRND